jgi:hypothetical protein
MHNNSNRRPYHSHVQVHIKQGVAVLTGVVESEQQKQEVINAVSELSEVQQIKNYLCVIAPFKPLSNWLRRSARFDVLQDVVVTVTRLDHHDDKYGRVIFHDSLAQAQRFLGLSTNSMASNK